MKITLQQFLVNQPSFPAETATDSYYLNIANRLLEKAGTLHVEHRWPESVLRAAALIVTGYFQDIVADAGLWRGFINEHRRLYGGKTLPFYEVSESYIDYELNKEDVQYMVWYSLAMLYEHTRALSPTDKDVIKLSGEWYNILEEAYDAAPIPEDFHLSHDLEVHDPEESERIARLAHWLYLHSWLLRPANAMTMAEVAAGLPEGEEERKELAARLDRAMNELPTGPLALYLREWLWLVCEDRMPPVSRKEQRAKEEAEQAPDHQYYIRFTAYTRGKRIAYFATYAELNEFFIKALGWAEGEEHLSQMKQYGNFVLLVDRKKGMLLAREVAQLIADPENALYNETESHEHAMEMLTVRGRCPVDLIKYVCDRGWLTEAHFDASDDTKLVSDNWDFIARCYLEQYYRGD